MYHLKIVLFVCLFFLINIPFLYNQNIYAQQENILGQKGIKISYNYSDVQFKTNIAFKNVDLNNNIHPLRFFTQFNSDSVSVDTNRIRKSPIGWTITKEIGLGTLLGVISILPSGYIGATIASHIGRDEFVPGLIGIYTGYLAGSSLGIYLAAKKDKPDISYWNILVSEVVGGGIGFGILSISDQRGIGSAAPIIIPLLAGIIYAELIK
jgi:hypothetical protein